MKRPRLSPTDHEAATDLQAPSPTSITPNLHPSSQVQQSGDLSIYPSPRENGLMMAPTHIPRPSQPQMAYQSWNPSPRASQTGGDPSYDDPRPISDKIYPGSDGKPDLPSNYIPIDPRLMRVEAVIGKTPASLPGSISSRQTSQQATPFAGLEAQHHQPQDNFYLRSPGKEQTAYSAPDAETVTQASPPTGSIEKQTRQFSASTGNTVLSLTLSKPAQGQDLEDFPWEERHVISTYSKTEQAKKDLYFMDWYEEVRRPFWAQIMTSFGAHVPASLYDQVLDELCTSHPCIVNPWVTHRVYKFTIGTAKRRPGGELGNKNLRDLKLWMYGARQTTDATWRDTLRTKAGDGKKVPWLEREKLLALSVLFNCGSAAPRKNVHNVEAADRNIRLRMSMLEDCKLTYLLSDQDHPVANEYWDGFSEELERDPQQAQQWDKVMQEEQTATSGSAANWPGSLIQDQADQGYGYENPTDSPGQSRQQGYGSQAGFGGIGQSQVLPGVGEILYQHSGHDGSRFPAQQSFLPQEDSNQETQHMQPMATAESMLRDRVRQLEGEVAELREYIQWMHQQNPGLSDQPPRPHPSNNHE